MSTPFGPGWVAVLSGPPGAGKTTVAAQIVELMSPSALVEGDTFFRALRAGRIEPWEPAADEQNATVIRALGAAASELAAGGLAVVVEGIIGPWMLDRFGAACTAPLHYVVLRLSLDEALRRATGRSGDELVDPGPITTMWHAFADLGAHEADTIDTTALSVPETVALVARRLGLSSPDIAEPQSRAGRAPGERSGRSDP